MNQSNRKQNSGTLPFADSRWRSLFKIAGIAALLTTVLGVTEVIIEGSGGVGLASAPSTVLEWFTLLQINRLIGLAVLGVFEMVFFPLGVLMFIGLYFALRHASESWMAIATAFYAIGTTVYFASNNALAMLGLSNQYVAAASDVQRSMLLAAGQAVMATEQGTGMAATFFLGSLAGIMVSIVMLRSQNFSKATAAVGIVANLFGLPGGALGLVPWTLNGLLMMVWTIMVGVQLLKLSRRAPTTEVPA